MKRNSRRLSQVMNEIGLQSIRRIAEFEPADLVNVVLAYAASGQVAPQVFQLQSPFDCERRYLDGFQFTDTPLDQQEKVPPVVDMGIPYWNSYFLCWGSISVAFWRILHRYWFWGGTCAQRSVSGGTLKLDSQQCWMVIDEVAVLPD